MLNVAKGELVLGQATILVQDHDEVKPRITKCDMVASDPHFAKRFRFLLRKLVRKLGFIAGVATIAMIMRSQSPEFETERHMPMVMGAITSALSTSFKTQLGTATHDFTITTGHVFRCALYTSSATLGAATTAYSATNEISGTGYTATGVVITSATPVASGTTAIFDFTDAQWTTSTFTANGCLVYNDTSSGDKSIFAVAFGSDQTVTAGTFTIQWPTADASNAIIRLA